MDENNNSDQDGVDPALTRANSLGDQVIVNGSIAETETNTFVLEHSYKKILLQHIETALHRNTDAHYKSAEKILQYSNVWRWINLVSAASLLTFSTSEAIQKILDAQTPLDSNVVLVVLGLIFLCTTIYHSVSRFEDRYFFHKTAAAAFSELRREVLQNLGSPVIKNALVRRLHEQYQLIVENSPLSDKGAWRRTGIKHSARLDELLNELREISRKI